MDLLGFLVFLALAFTQPQLFRYGWNALKRYWDKFSSLSPDTRRVLAFWTSEQFLKLAIILGIAEGVWYNYLPQTAESFGYENYYLALCYGSIAIALWNFLSGFGRMVTRRTTDDAIVGPEDDVSEKNTERVWRYGITVTSWRSARFAWLNRALDVLNWLLGWYDTIRRFLDKVPLIGFILRPHPFIWLALVMGGWLLQGATLEYYAIRYIPDYSDQQWLIVYGWFSKLVYGAIAFAASGLIGWFVVKGTRFVERFSTILAKIVISIPTGIEYDKNALAEIGGPIELIDEKAVAASIRWALTVLFVPLLVFDIAVFLWPDALIAGTILVGITITGLLEFIFGQMGEYEAKEGYTDRVKRMRSIFKMGPVIAVILFVLGNFLAQTLTGWNIQIEAGNFWYGVSYYTHFSFWFHFFVTTGFLLIAVRYLKKAYQYSVAAVKSAEAEGDVKGWHATPKRYVAYTLLTAWCGAAVLAFLIAYSALASAFGAEKVRLSMALDQKAVTFYNVTVNRVPVFSLPDEPWPLLPPKNGRVRVEFDTPEKAYGVVEFDSPKAARAAGMPSYVTVISDQSASHCLVTHNEVRFTEERKDVKICNTKLYHHVAEFYVSPEFYGSYRIAMRNAHAIPPNPETKTTGEMGDHYGRVAMSAPVQILEPVEPPIYAGWWGAICKWWHDLWDDDDDDHRPPPRTVVVVRDPVPVYAPAPCKGCKVTPLKVEPSLRDEVASARRR